jgi:Rrf2 family protein
MSLYGASIETGLHCIVSLVDPPDCGPPSTRELAEFQGLSPSHVAKLFTKLAKAGLVTSAEGIQGGFQLAKYPADVSLWDVVSALEPNKPLFRCREIRRNFILFKKKPPRWATCGLCPIHAAMREAEKQMRLSLEAVTLADIAAQVGATVPTEFNEKANAWLAERRSTRRDSKAD